MDLPSRNVHMPPLSRASQDDPSRPCRRRRRASGNPRHTTQHFFGFAAGAHKVATSTFSAPIENVSNPAARFLHRTPYPVAWCPWVSPTGADAALSFMSWQHHFLARKFGKNSRENVMNYRCPFWPHTEAVCPPTAALPMQYHSLVWGRCRVSAGLHAFAGQACRKRWSVGMTNDVKTPASALR